MGGGLLLIIVGVHLVCVAVTEKSTSALLQSTEICMQDVSSVIRIETDGVVTMVTYCCHGTTNAPSPRNLMRELT